MAPQEQEANGIPVVDFSAWQPGAPIDQRKVVADQIIAACRKFGFVYITNHSVSPKRLEEAFAMSKKLYDLPFEKKQLAPHPPGFTVHRGYSKPGLEKVSNAMGDETDGDALVKDLRKVGDAKVTATSALLAICSMCCSS